MTLVAMYHYVRDVQDDGLKALKPHDFRTQLDWLAADRHVISLADFEAAAAAGRSLDRTALLTFDDGFVDHYSVVFGELRRRQMSGVFFLAGAALGPSARVLNVHKTHLLMAHLGAKAFADEARAAVARHSGLTESALPYRREVYRYDGAATDVEIKHLLNYELPYAVVDRVLGEMLQVHLGDEQTIARTLYLSTEQIREMAKAGMSFGFHTERHRVLSRLTKAEQLNEIARGVECIQSLTGQRSVPFCYPYGHVHTFNDDTVSILMGCGYSVAFTTERRYADPARDNRMLIPRFDTRDLPPFSETPDA